jgi:hypothetical protein
MKNFIIALSILNVFWLSSCEKDKNPEPANFSLEVGLTYGASPFTLNTAYTDPQGMRIRLEQVRFYLTNITALKTDGSKTTPLKAALLDASNPASMKVKLNLPEGTYSGIQFGLGLDSALNNADPTVLPSSDPLAAPDMYWTWLKYIFVKLEGRSDTTTNATGNLDWLLVYHLGTPQAYRVLNLNKSFEVKSGNEGTFPINLDLQKVFYTTGNVIDIRTESFTHSESSTMPVTIKMADNFAGAFSVR